MRKRPIYLGLLLLAVLMVIGFFVSEAVCVSEPEYGGKKLSEWMRRYSWASGRNDPIGMNESIEAVRHVGTNALPCLLKWIRHEQPLSRRIFFGLSTTILRKIRDDWIIWDNKEVRADQAMFVFQILGRGAEAAIPDLAVISEETNARLSARRSVDALGYLGDKAFPPLVRVLASRQDGNVRRSAVWAIKRSGTNAVPFLIERLKGSDLRMKSAATILLDRIAPGTVEKVEQGE